MKKDIQVLTKERLSSYGTIIEHSVNGEEDFEPLSGLALIVAAVPEDPEAIEVFLLDQPICINAGVWHNVVALSEECRGKL